MKAAIVGLFLLAAGTTLHAASPDPFPDDPACTDTDRGFMKRANELAAEAVKQGNTPFGAILVLDGKIVGEYSNVAATTHDPTKHAECALISAFAPKIGRAELKRSVLYASSEPCIMCCGAILNAGIPKVVYGVTESQFLMFTNHILTKNPLTSRETISRTDPAVQVLGPLMEREGLALHAAFGRRR